MIRRIFFLMMFNILVLGCVYSPNIHLRLLEGILLMIIIFLIHLWCEKVMQINTMKKDFRQKNDILNDIFKHSPDLIFYKDKDFKYAGCNQTFAELHGNTRESIVGKTDFEILPENAESIRLHDEKVMNSGQLYMYEQILSHPLSEKRIYQVIKSPLKDENNNVIGILGISRDITEAKEVDDQKETFVATLTHDLKTPTNSQIRTLELLLNGGFGELTTSQKEILTHVLNSCKYMFNMISTILSTYKYDKGKKQPVFSEFDFSSLLKDSCDELNYLADENNIKLELKIAKNVPPISADFVDLKRVVTNLISNAITYSLNKSTVKISSEIEDNKLKFMVKNNSKFASQEDIDCLFEKFFTGFSKFRQVGTGLGLYLSKQIITAHGGSMIVESNEEAGNTFGFELELAK